MSQTLTPSQPGADNAPNQPTRESWASILPGLLFVTFLAALAIILFKLPFVEKTLHFSSLLIVIVLAMLWRTLLPVPDKWLPGIKLAQKPILRLAVAGLGFKLTLSMLWSIGASALLIVLVTTAAGLFFGFWIAKVLGLNDKLGTLLGVGTAVCGASAIVAADSVVQGEKSDIAASLGIITFLGTLAIVIYPLLGALLHMPEFTFGIWSGASIHEVAQVVAAASNYNPVEHLSGPHAVDVANVTKLARICLLAPIVFYLAASLKKKQENIGETKVSAVPWFLTVFVIFALLNSVIAASSFAASAKPAIDWILLIDLWLMTIGMAGVGLQAGFKDLKNAGFRPILAGTLQWTFMAVLSYALATLVLH